MTQIFESCSGCGSHDVVIERDRGFITYPWRMIRCRACGELHLYQIPLWWTLAFWTLAAAAAIWGWVSIF